MKTLIAASITTIAIPLVVAGCGHALDNMTGPSESRPPAPAVPPTVLGPPGATTCIAANAEWAVGSAASDDLLERARVAANASVARFLTPKQPITTEYLATRLNLEIDEIRKVLAVRCG
jgi:hypothetical protein